MLDAAATVCTNEEKGITYLLAFYEISSGLLRTPAPEGISQNPLLESLIPA